MGYWLFRATNTEYSLCESLCVFALLSSTTKAGPPCLSCIPKGVRPARASGSCGRGGCLRARPVAAWWGATASPPPAQWSAVPTTPTSPRYRIDAKTWLPPRWVTVVGLLMPAKRAWGGQGTNALACFEELNQVFFSFLEVLGCGDSNLSRLLWKCDFITFFFSKLKECLWWLSSRVWGSPWPTNNVGSPHLKTQRAFNSKIQKNVFHFPTVWFSRNWNI